ncbi:MAG: glycosyl hydrolase family 18 protein [Terracidiphilus sp.]|jgi:chitinase
MNRRFFSVLAVCFALALLIGCPGSASAATCAAAWNSTTAYTAGMTVSENSINYVANWWTQGNDPATNNGGSGTGEPWTSQGACTSGTSCTTVLGAFTLSASGTTSTGTTLSWTTPTAANCTVTGYEVYQGGVAKAAVAAGTTTYAVSGLTAGTAYSFYVVATDSIGNTTSNTVSVTTTSASCATAPGSLTLSASGTTSSGTTLSWTVPSEGTGCTLTGYEVYQGGVAKAAVAAGTTTYAVSGLTASTAYSFYVAATNAKGTTDSNTLSVTTSAPPSCTSVPGSLTVSASGTTSSGTTLSWTVPTEGTSCTLTGYEVYQGGAAKAAVAAGTTTYAVSGLTPSTAYSFYVAASNSDGATNSNTLSVTTLSGSLPTCGPAWVSTTAYTAGQTVSYQGNNYTAAFWTQGNIPSSNSGGTGTGEPWSLPTACSSNVCTSAPGAFTVSASGTTNTGTNLAWTVPTEGASCTLSGYEVYQGGVAKTAIAAGTTSDAVSGLTAGTTYSFYIAATNADGVTDSNTLSVTTTGTNPCTAVPGVPTGLTGSSSASTTVSLSWTASTIPTGCTLTNYTITGGPSSVTSTGTSATITGLTPNTSYTFTVKATDSFGTSAASSSFTVKTLNGPSSYFVGGWYEEWGTYYANYNVSDLLNTGMVPSLTHVIYAFAAPSQDGSSCVLEDAYADYQKVVPLLTGAPALPTGLAGNLGGLWQLKQLYPNLKILISIGGWHPASAETSTFPYSFNLAFKAASATAASQQAFVSSCISTFIQGNFASGLTVPGIFDGVDIDWEFPNATETAGFTGLITEFRTQLTTLSGTTGKTYQVLADLAAGASTPGAAADSGSDGGYDTIDIPGLSAQLDFMNVDGYNYAGDWSAATDEASPLYDDSLDTANALYPNNSIDYTVKYYLGKGAPAAKYTMGMPAYGVGWAGGLTSTNSGMYQTATGEVDPTGATTTNGTAAVPNTNGVGNCPTGENQSSPTTGCDPLLTDGLATYRTIENLIGAGGYTVSYDSTRVDVNMFNPTTDTVWNYDNPTSIAAKVAYIKANGLGGAYVWAVKDDDTSGSLTKALGNGLN